MDFELGTITWYAYTVEDGEIRWVEFEADSLGEARRICQKNGWELDDDYDRWIPKMIFW